MTCRELAKVLQGRHTLLMTPWRARTILVILVVINLEGHHILLLPMTCRGDVEGRLVAAVAWLLLQQPLQLPFDHPLEQHQGLVMMNDVPVVDAPLVPDE